MRKLKKIYFALYILCYIVIQSLDAKIPYVLHSRQGISETKEFHLGEGYTMLVNSSARG